LREISYSRNTAINAQRQGCRRIRFFGLGIQKVGGTAEKVCRTDEKGLGTF